MPDDFEVRGAERFLQLSKALKQAGELGLRRELNKALQLAARPLIQQTREAARGRLPRHGGLAESVARAPQRVQVRTGLKTAGIRIVASGPVKGADSGSVRHPVFGKRSVFVEQTVPGGWFHETLHDSAPTVRPALEAAVVEIERRIGEAI
jgi:hypothetical protein